MASSSACTLYSLDAALVSVVYPQSSVCQNTFSPVILVQNNGTQTITSLLVNMVVDQSSFYQQQWTGSLATGESVYIPVNAVTLADGTHDLNIYVSNPNNGVDALSSNDTKDISITVANQSGPFALSLPVIEGFENPGFPPTLWEVSSVGGASGEWGLSTEGGFGSSPNGAKVDFFTGNTSGQIQSLVTSYFEVPSGNSLALSFSYAYARRDSLTNDTLNVYFSFDCGDNWTKFWSKGGIRLQTAPSQNTAFVPTSSQWERAAGINLKQAEGQSLVRLKFEAVSRGGNNIYIDDINLDSWVVGIGETEVVERVINLFPNPANGQVTIKEEGVSQGSSTITLFDLQGRLILTHSVVALHNGYALDVSGLNAGMYLVRVSSQAGEAFKKLIIE